MTTVLLLTGLCLVLLLGAALPLLRRTHLPPPPEGGWKTWPNDDCDADAAKKAD